MQGLTTSTGMLGRTLIVTQVALSLVLLLGAGLLIRSFRKLCSSKLGFQKEDVLQFDLTPRQGAYKNLDMKSYHQQLIDRLSSLLGVGSLAFADFSVGYREKWDGIVAKTTDAPSPSAGVMASATSVAPGFFHAFGITLLRGRDFNWTDDKEIAAKRFPLGVGDQPRVAILSRSLAKRLFPSGNALGQRIRFGFMPETQNLELAGVADNARLLDLHDPAPAVIYLPSTQRP
jgi:hypothetical protein